MQIANRYGDLATCVKPAQTLPPITSASPCTGGTTSSPATTDARDEWSGESVIVTTASSMSTADTSSMFTAPICGASAAVAAEPMMDPAVPPTPMKPKRRFACSLRQTSAISVQKIDVLNSAN